MKKAFRSVLSCLVIVGMVITYFTPVQAMEQQLDTFTSEADMLTVKNRLKEYFLGLDTIDDGAKVEACYVSEAKEYLDSMQADGSWSDVDYKVTTSAANGRPWDPYLALDRMQALAIAYHKEGHELYNDARVVTALNNALTHWKQVKPTCTNWWEVDIGVNLRFGRIGLFMENVISEESLNIIINNLHKDGKYHGTGQNNLWYDQNAMYRAMLTNNGDKLKEVIDDCLAYVLVLQTDNKTLEALQVDNSLYFHGEQFYSNGYGLSMFRDVSFWLYILRDTSFALNQEVVDRMSDYMLDGTRWTIRGDIAELYLGYRPYKFDVGFSNYADEYIEPLKRMMTVDSTRASEYQVLLDNLTGKRNDNGANGNHYMWRVGYSSHMRNNYGVNIKMDSKRIIGGEWRGSWAGGPDNGNLIYWTSSASSTIMVDGDEYTPIYPTYDWKHAPGTTTAYRLPSDYNVNYGRLNNGTEHTIGVTNGTYGSTAYVMNKKDTQATKGYFFFEDEFVALGAGISSKESVGIHTTLNQSKAENVTVDGQSVPTGTKVKDYTGRWIHNDKIGYVFREDTNVKVSNALQKENPSLWAEAEKEAAPEAFTAYIDHGIKPADDSYEYIVLPNKTVSEVDAYSKDIPIVTVANTKEVQAVRHDGLKVTQINFYKAGTLEYALGKSVTVDQPCSLIIDEKGSTPEISLAVTDTDYNKTVNVNLEINGLKSTTGFVVAGAPYTGQTMTQNAGEDSIYTASSAVDEHPARHAYDGSIETYWKSEVGESQWIAHVLGENTFVSKVKIHWKDNYAKAYKIQASSDGKTFEDVATITNGDGGEDLVEVNTLATHVRIVCEESNANAGYEIKEITYETGENLALSGTASASSVSSQSPALVASNANDGDYTSRWASKRDSHTEWLMIDLGDNAELHAVIVHWEAARSAKYTVEVSDDGKSWKVLKTVEETENLVDKILLDKGAEGKYVRINSSKSKVLDKNYGISMYEIEIYGKVVPKTETNVALNKYAYANSIDNADTPGKAVDGNMGSWWKSASGTDHWLAVALKDTYAINKVKVNWYDGFMDAYEIQVSNDTENWTTVATGAGVKDGDDAFEFTPVDAKYVRIIGTTTTSKKVVLREFEVFGVLKETNDRENLALNKESTASSEYKDGSKTYTSSLAFDGNMATLENGMQSRWVSNRNSDNEWIQVDLGDMYAVDSLLIFWEGTGVHEYKLLVSEDNQNWKEVKYVDGGTCGLKEVKLESPVKARYVKMEGVKVGNKYGYSIYEFEVYGEAYSLPNVALHKESKASSEYLDTKDGGKVYYSSLAFDGNTSSINGKQSRWVSNRESDNEWIYVNLDGKHEISSIVLNWEGKNTHEYKVQISNDAYTWEDVGYAKEEISGKKTFTFEEPIHGQYVRMQGIKVGGKYGYSLWEFEVYGEKIANFYVDKTTLEEIITEHTGISGDNYTKNSYKAYTDALSAANTALTNVEATQEDVNKCIDDLNEAVSNLEVRNTEALSTAIALAKTKVEDNYTAESYSAMKTILEEAEELLENGANTNEEYAQVAGALQAAIDALVEKPVPEVTAQDIADLITELEIVNHKVVLPEYEGFTITIKSSTDTEVIALDGTVTPKVTTCQVGVVLKVVKDNVTREASEDIGYTGEIEVEVTGVPEVIDYEGLKAVIALAKEKQVDSYTAFSYQAMKNILKEAEALIENSATSNEEVEVLRSALSEAINNLVNLEGLKEEVAKAKGIDTDKYTSTSSEAVVAAIAKADTILKKVDATKEEVANAITALQVSYTKLEEKGDRTELEEIIEKLENMDTSKYTPESVGRLEELLKEAKELLEAGEASKEEVESMVKKLEEAKENLVENTGGSMTPEPEEKPIKPGTTKDLNKVETADTIMISPFLITMLLSLVGWYMSRRKKEQA